MLTYDETKKFLAAHDAAISAATNDDDLAASLALQYPADTNDDDICYLNEDFTPDYTIKHNIKHPTKLCPDHTFTIDIAYTTRNGRPYTIVLDNDDLNPQNNYDHHTLPGHLNSLAVAESVAAWHAKSVDFMVD